ncbi:sugar/nucleoside kinase (ribokinase family) [Desulfomicrobium macestii]|uniref:Sugar or nucleoside kinase, ribokinase family n=2 Tax=Desulfomicrobium TaxID=898 RepID=A0A8G2F921_DESNO|nr:MULTISPECIES: adenosine kinase [Desulfomicrobium]MBE1426860.1 sugar/nucleoside kinase (ribokinase family) [Desulfomicrobium macestii]SFM20906.1 Sugar or nucleoside kinase, ribokinase family [Desulfomicrobium norvegicum]
MKKYDVYGMGNALVDMEFEVPDAFLETMGVEKGFMTLVDEERQFELLEYLRSERSVRSGGGSAANTIVANAFFGGKSFYTCLVSNDEMGDFYAQELARAGVGTNLAERRADGVTGKCLVMITPDAERTMNTYLGISESLSAEQLCPEELRESEFLYSEGYLVTSPTARPAVVQAMNIAREAGVRTALSFSDPSMVKYFRLGLEEIVGEGVDLLFCNREEAMLWAECRTLAKAVDKLRRNAKTFVVTLGGEGALVYDGEDMHEIDACRVTPLDTNGAGDMFAGAFLYGITHDMNYVQAGEFASLAASKVVTTFGPRLQPEQYARTLAEFRAR